MSSESAGISTFRPSFLSPIMALFRLTVIQYLRGRRGWLLAALFALPAGLAILIRVLNEDTPANILEFYLMFTLLPHALAPLTALLYASGMIQDEVEEQTLTYLLIRPLPRWALYLTKYLATLITSCLLVSAGTVVLYIAIYWGDPDCWGTIFPVRALKTASIFCLGQAGYCALFAALMLLTRRWLGLLAGVGFILFVEGLLANLQFVVRQATIVFYSRVLALRWLDLPDAARDEWKTTWGLDLQVAPSATYAVQALAGAALVFVLLAMVRFNRMEFSMKTPEGN